jgi:hypothetical protein
MDAQLSAMSKKLAALDEKLKRQQSASERAKQPEPPPSDASPSAPAEDVPTGEPAELPAELPASLDAGALAVEAPSSDGAHAGCASASASASASSGGDADSLVRLRCTASGSAAC